MMRYDSRYQCSDALDILQDMPDKTTNMHSNIWPHNGLCEYSNAIIFAYIVLV